MTQTTAIRDRIVEYAAAGYPQHLAPSLDLYRQEADDQVAIFADRHGPDRWATISLNADRTVNLKLNDGQGPGHTLLWFLDHLPHHCIYDLCRQVAQQMEQRGEVLRPKWSTPNRKAKRTANRNDYLTTWPSAPDSTLPALDILLNLCEPLPGRRKRSDVDQSMHDVDNAWREGFCCRHEWAWDTSAVFDMPANIHAHKHQAYTLAQVTASTRRPVILQTLVHLEPFAAYLYLAHTIHHDPDELERMPTTTRGISQRARRSLGASPAVWKILKTIDPRMSAVAMPSHISPCMTEEMLTGGRVIAQANIPNACPGALAEVWNADRYHLAASIVPGAYRHYISIVRTLLQETTKEPSLHRNHTFGDCGYNIGLIDAIRPMLNTIRSGGHWRARTVQDYEDAVFYHQYDYTHELDCSDPRLPIGECPNHQDLDEDQDLDDQD